MIGTTFAWTNGKTWKIESEPYWLGGELLVNIRCISSSARVLDRGMIRADGVGDTMRLSVESLNSILGVSK